MISNVIKHEYQLSQKYYKNYFLTCLIAVLVGLVTYQKLKFSKFSVDSLMLAVLSTDQMAFYLVPFLIMIILTTFNFKNGDILRCQTRNVIFFQALYRILFPYLLMETSWMIVNLMVILLGKYRILLKEIWFSLLIRSIFMWLSCLAFAIIAAIFYFYLQNKIMAFFICLGISCLSKGLQDSQQISLFYDFVVPNTGKDIFLRIIIVTILIGLFYKLLKTGIEQKDF